MTQASPKSPGCAIALIVMGLLILVPSGLCTTLVAFNSSRNDLAMILTFGGPAILLGGGLLLAGYFWLRKVDESPPDRPKGET